MRNDFTLAAHVAALQTGTGDLVDGQILYSVCIVDNKRFSKLGLASANLTVQALAIRLEPFIQASLAPLARHYATLDLLDDGIAVEKVSAQFREALANSLAEFGLKLTWSQRLAFYRSEEVAALAERRAELRRQLRLAETVPQQDAGQKQTKQDIGQTQTHGAMPDRFGQFATQANRLRPSDLQRIDRLWRQQATAELKRLSATIGEIRSYLYRNGQADLAWQGKELEAQIAITLSDVAHLYPVYLGSPDLSLAERQQVLSRDGAWLNELKDLNDIAQAILREALVGQSSVSRRNELEVGLMSLQHHLKARGFCT